VGDSHFRPSSERRNHATTARESHNFASLEQNKETTPRTMKFELLHDDHTHSTDEVEASLLPTKGQLFDDEPPQDIESLLEKYEQELSSTLESIQREAETKFDDDDDDDDDGCFVEMARVSFERTDDRMPQMLGDLGHEGSTHFERGAPPDAIEKEASSKKNGEDLMTQYQQAMEQWHSLLQQKQLIHHLHYSAMCDACEKDDVSPFMLGRLAELSFHEYQSMVFNGSSRRLHNDYRVLINWLYQQIEAQENERQTAKVEYEQRIAQTRVELTGMTRQRKKLELDALIAAKQILVSALRSSNST
jgi:hypothetical protein